MVDNAAKYSAAGTARLEWNGGDRRKRSTKTAAEREEDYSNYRCRLRRIR
jgi:hypothetical protein